MLVYVLLTIYTIIRQCYIASKIAYNAYVVYFNCYASIFEIRGIYGVVGNWGSSNISILNSHTGFLGSTWHLTPCKRKKVLRVPPFNKVETFNSFAFAE